MMTQNEIEAELATIYETGDISSAAARAILQAYDIADRAGDGFAIGDSLDPIEEIAEAGTYLGMTATRGYYAIAVYRDGGDLVLVGDVHGPWAVRVEVSQ